MPFVLCLPGGEEEEGKGEKKVVLTISLVGIGKRVEIMNFGFGRICSSMLHKKRILKIK